MAYGTLLPQHWFGRHGASGILTWKNVQGQDFQRAVILPGVEIHSEFWDGVSGFVKAIEICALPIALALLAWWLKQKQDQREADAKASQIRQIHLQETWNLQLPKVVENVMGYCMPAAHAIQHLLSSEVKTESSDEELLLCLFRMLRLIKRMSDLSEKVGGFFFKDFDGENLALECWGLFSKASREQLNEVEGTRVNDILHPQVSFAQFLDLLNGLPETGLSQFQRPRIAESLQKLAGCLKTWIAKKKFEDDLAPLRVLLPIFIFEANRPLEHWYGHLPEFNYIKFEEAVKKLPETEAGLKSRLATYGVNCTKAVERSRLGP